MLNVRFTYSTWTLFTLQFSSFFFKNVKRRRIFSFLSGTRFHIWDPLYVTVSVSYFTVPLFVEYRHWKFLILQLLFLIIKAPFIIDGVKPFKPFMSWKVLTWSLWINLRASSLIWLIRLFKEHEQNIHISGQ